MSELTKGQLRSDNNSSFPNNNAQAITPTILRDYNGNIIDSLVDEITYQEDSGSWNQKISNINTGSLVESASFDNGTRTQTFTKADGSTFTNVIPDGGAIDTGSLLVTASVVDATTTYTKGDGSVFTTTIDNVLNATNATSASHAVFAEDSDDLILNVKNTSGADIGKGLAVHATGVTGENVNIELADSSNSSNMPSIGITRDIITNNASGVIVISGKIVGLNTSGLVAGEQIYVSTAGVLTSTKPTGSALIQNMGVCGKVNASEGEIIVQGSGRVNDLPNIVEGYSWVGNTNGVPTAVSTASWDDQTDITSLNAFTSSITTRVDGLSAETSSYAKTDVNNVFSGNQTFNDITVNGTGSFAYIQSVTGSAKTIGDAFIQLNNDTPTQRYAGIKVLDSGSASPTTASLQYDGGTNDWFFEKEVSGTAEFGVVLGGPEYTALGSPTYNASNKVLKGTGGHHIVDSNITDDGSLVNITSNTDITGSVGIDGTLGISGISNVSESIASASAGGGDPFPFTGNAEITGSLIVSQSGLSSGDDVFLLGYPRTGGNSLQGVIRSTVDDGMHFYGNKFFNNGSNTFNGGITGFEAGPVQMGPAGSPVNLEFQNGSAIVVNPQSSTLPITGNVDISGSLAILGISDVSASIAAASGGGGSVPAGTVSGSSQIDYPLISNIPAGIVSGSSQIDITATTNYGDVATQAGNNTFSGDNEFGTSGTTQNFNGTNNIPTIAGDVIVSDGGNGSTITVQGTGGGGNRATRMDVINVTATNNGTDKAYLGGGFGSYFSVVDSLTNDEIGFVLKSQTYSGTGWTGPGISSNANNGYETVMGWQDQANYTDNRTTFRTPAEFQDLVEIKKAVITNVTSVTPDGVNNIEIDFATTGIQEVTLGNGVTNSFTTNNVTAGQTINLKITQNATAASSVSFSSDFKQPDGSAYVPTADLGAVDILTLMTFTSTSDVYIVAVNKFV